MQPESTVLQLANAQPLTVRVLARHGIDVLDETEATLEDVCRGRGLRAEDLLAEIRDEPGAHLPPERDWSTVLDPALLDHILEAYHRPLARELPRLEDLARAAYRGAQEERATLSEILRTFRRLRAALELHVRKEEGVLFPLLRRGQGHMATAPIALMRQEHDELRGDLRALRRLTGGYRVADDGGGLYASLCRGLRDLEEDLTRHMLLENTELYRRAEAAERRA